MFRLLAAVVAPFVAADTAPHWPDGRALTTTAVTIMRSEYVLNLGLPFSNVAPCIAGHS